MADIADRAQDVIEADLGRSLRAHRSRPVNAGSGGLCGDCDDPISPERLRAQPTAGRCVGCQSAFERRNR